MSKQNPEIPSDQPISLTIDQLKEIVNAASAAQSGNSGLEQKFSQLVEAIIESRKPYVAPGTEENEEEFRRLGREQEAFKKQNREWAQRLCAHRIGAGGPKPGENNSGFWIHRTDTGETIGICCSCQKVISSLNPEDAPLFAGSANVPSSAGQRSFYNAFEAQIARLTPEERKIAREKNKQFITRQ
jgi:tRNA A37 threonylcarbamoyladenosine synthetase subunit TsaC/SUA5/YrdC